MGDSWEIAIKNQGLIKWYLSKNQWVIDKSRVLDYSDYWQIGVMAIYHAAGKFDASKGSFPSYALKWIRQQINLAHKTQAYPAIRIPRSRYNHKNISVSCMDPLQLWFHNAVTDISDISAADIHRAKNHGKMSKYSEFINNFL